MAGDIQITGKTPGKTNTVVQSLNKALAYSILDFKNTLQVLVDESNPANANVFIDEWEKMVGIPDDIFAVESTLEKRVQNVLFKMTSGIEATKAGIRKLATIFGLEVEFGNWQDKNSFIYTFGEFIFYAPETMPYRIFLRITTKTTSEEQAEHFAYEFPMVFSKSNYTNFENVLRKIIPATHDLIIMRL